MIEIKSAYADLKNPLYEVIDELTKLQARMDNLGPQAQPDPGETHMRIDLKPILNQATTLIAAIEAKSQSRASSAAHVLLCTLPDPTWAETAPGCRIYYGFDAVRLMHL